MHAAAQPAADAKANATVANPVIDAKEAQAIIERADGMRYDIFSQTWLEAVITFERYALQLSGSLKLSFQKKSIKKLQLFAEAEEYEPMTGRVQRKGYCLQITTEDKQKHIVSLDVNAGEKLRKFLESNSAVYDRTLINPYERNTKCWEHDYESTDFQQFGRAGQNYRVIREFMATQVMELVTREKVSSVVFVEYGCGYANLLRKCVERCQEQKVEVVQAIGTDNNDGALDKAKQKHLQGAHAKLFQFFKVDSLELAKELKLQPKENTRVIALSSGATNYGVLDNVSDAFKVFNNLHQLKVDYVFMSGITPILCNNTIAKRAFFKIERRLEVIKIPDRFLMLRRMNAEEMKHYQAKFQSFVSTPTTHNIQIATTPGLFGRLFSKPIEVFPTTIKDEKQLFKMIGELSDRIVGKIGDTKFKEEEKRRFNTLVDVYKQRRQRFESGPKEIKDARDFIQASEKNVNEGNSWEAPDLILIYRYGIQLKSGEHGLVEDGVQKEMKLYFYLFEQQFITHDEYVNIMHFVLNSHKISLNQARREFQQNEEWDDDLYQRERQLENAIRQGLELLNKARRITPADFPPTPAANKILLS